MPGQCRHHWSLIGPALPFQGQQCVLWRCLLCDKEHETFADCRPSYGTFAEAVE